MNRKNHNLDELLTAFFVESDVPTPEILDSWVAQYPEYEKELRDFAMAWAADEWLLTGQRRQVDSSVPVKINRKRISELVKQAQQSVEPTTLKRGPIRGFISEIKTVGLSLDQFVNQLGLSQTIVAKLDRRLIEYISIPLALIERIAGALNREVIVVSKYLAGNQMISRSARFKSISRPLIPPKENFFDVIRNDEFLDERLREQWLEMENSRGPKLKMK